MIAQVHINRPITHPVTDVGLLTSFACPNLVSWSMPKYGGQTSVNKDGMGLPLIPCKEIYLGPKSTSKLAHDGRIVQVHLRRPIVHPFANVELLTIIKWRILKETNGILRIALTQWKPSWTLDNNLTISEEENQYMQRPFEEDEIPGCYHRLFWGQIS